MIDDKTRTSLLARAMLTGYATRYPAESFAVESVESEFVTKIRNPETGAESRSFTLAGKVDGLVRLDGKLWLMEHKTAAGIDGAYLEKLWMDFQTTLYAHAIEQTSGEPVEGTIYNVIAKAAIRPYEIGKKRTQEETPEEFAVRLAEWYTDPKAYHREELLISRDRFAVLDAELWELTQALLDAKRRDVWYQNPGQCFQWNHACAYWPICRSCDNPNVVANDYTAKVSHAELAPTEEENGRTRTTYSGWSSFRDCRRRFYWRYIKQIVPIRDEVESLFLGSVVHAGLAEWHKTRDLTAALSVIDSETNTGIAKPPAF